jgi:hypothetical protein
MQMMQQQAQSRGMMSGQNMLPNMNSSLPGIPSMSNMNMGMNMNQMNPMGMNPYMYMPP